MTMTVRCPICRKLVTWQGSPHRPFCSERCRLIDLGHWATERYRIPGEAAPQSPASSANGDVDGDDGKKPS